MTIKSQSKNVIFDINSPQDEREKLTCKLIQELEINIELFYKKNKNKEYFSLMMRDAVLAFLYRFYDSFISNMKDKSYYEDFLKDNEEIMEIYLKKLREKYGI